MKVTTVNLSGGIRLCRWTSVVTEYDVSLIPARILLPGYQCVWHVLCHFSCLTFSFDQPAYEGDSPHHRLSQQTASGKQLVVSCELESKTLSPAKTDCEIPPPQMLDVIFNGRPIQRFWFLETVARMPYFSYISMLHLYETLGW